MSKNLATIPAQTTQRMERLDGLKSGTYWRCTRKVKDGHGQAIKSGVTLLLLAVKRVDGAPHTVVLHHHPEAEIQQHHPLLVGDFLKSFEPAFDHEKTRGGETADLQRRIGEMQRALIAGPAPAELDVPAAIRAALPAPGKALEAAPLPSVDTTLAGLVANAHRIQDLQKQAERQTKIAEATAKWVQTRSDGIVKATKTLGGYYAERAAASLASVEDVVQRAGKIQQGVQTLGLYTGQDVHVERLCEGEGAPADAPLTLFQRKLFMDEEHLIHLGYGGADWKDFDDFAEALGQDKALLDRIIPAPRGVVAMAPRRRDKSYGGDGSKGAALLEFLQNEQNKAGFLLVRDGCRVWSVRSELATQDSPRLFPTTDEANKPFRGWGGETIGIDHIKFTDALAQHERIALHYKRLLVLLWGLNDRLNLFGDFFDRSRYANFLSLDFQRERFRFVYDDENLLGDGRPTWREWREKMNAHLRSGSRVACVWKRLMTPASAPACVYWPPNGRTMDDRLRWRAKPLSPHAVAIVKRQDGELVVEAAVKGDSWRKSDDEQRRFNAAVSLTAYLNDKLRDHDDGFLCLDAVRLEDLDHYIQSRASRQDYMDYIEAFFAAREALLKDAEIEGPFKEEARDALVVGGIVKASDRDAASVRDAVDEATRHWRAEHRGAAVPWIGAPERRATLEIVLDQAYTLLGRDRDVSGEAADLARAEGRKPLRLVLTGKGGLALYVEARDDERENRVGPHAWVSRLALKRLKSGLKADGRRWTLLPKVDATETILKEWPEAAQWTGLPSPGGLAYDAAKAAGDRIDAWRDSWARVTSAPSDAEFEARLMDADALLNERSKRFVQLPDLLIPVGAASREGHRTTDRFLVCLEMPVHAALHRFGTKRQRERMEDWPRRVYAREDVGLKKLRELSARGFGVKLVYLKDAPKLYWRAGVADGLIAKAGGGRDLERTKSIAKAIAALGEDWRLDRLADGVDAALAAL